MTQPTNIRELEPKACEKIVSLLEQMLVKAKAGELVGIGIATVERGAGASGTSYYYSTRIDSAELIGMVSLLHYRLCKNEWQVEE